jgi:hypothetical protein
MRSPSCSPASATVRGARVSALIGGASFLVPWLLEIVGVLPRAIAFPEGPATFFLATRCDGRWFNFRIRHPDQYLTGGSSSLAPSLRCRNARCLVGRV